MTEEYYIPDGITFQPVTTVNWEDMQTLFRMHHEFSGCWCMYWRLKRHEFDKGYGEGNRQAMAAIVASGETPGILAYIDGKPAGWCSVAPRSAFGSLQRSPKLKPVDDLPVWSIVCFFVARQWRGMGLSYALIKAAIDYASGQGAKIVEAYPLIPEASKNPGMSIYMGVISTFQKLGFHEVERRSPLRAIMRYEIRGQ
jgi:GNAT superfamily N-acetyltransferase